MQSLTNDTAQCDFDFLRSPVHTLQDRRLASDYMALESFKLDSDMVSRLKPFQPQTSKSFQFVNLPAYNSADVTVQHLNKELYEYAVTADDSREGLTSSQTDFEFESNYSDYDFQSMQANYSVDSMLDNKKTQSGCGCGDCATPQTANEDDNMLVDCDTKSESDIDRRFMREINPLMCFVDPFAWLRQRDMDCAEPISCVDELVSPGWCPRQAWYDEINSYTYRG